jgi:hypothetical protein
MLESREKAWPGTFRRWKAWLLRQPDGAERVVDALEKSDLRNARDEAGKRPVGDALRYFQSRLFLLNYADARKRGLPIGSGAVEATCKSLVSIRMKRCGSRWKHQSGNEILQLRAPQLSDRCIASLHNLSYANKYPPMVLCPLWAVLGRSGGPGRVTYPVSSLSVWGSYRRWLAIASLAMQS